MKTAPVLIITILVTSMFMTTDCTRSDEIDDGEDGLSSSIILRQNEKYRKILNTWLQPTQRKGSVWKRCWRGSVDGWLSSDFHSRCNNKGPTVTIIKVGPYVFGGYTSASWSYQWKYEYDPSAFLFSLVNRAGLGPLKLPLKGIDSKPQWHAIYSYYDHGPIFGNGHDLFISSRASSSKSSYANLGYSYSLPQGYKYADSDAKSFLAGSSYFEPDEIEVFYESLESPKKR